ncbi:hypothetical protein GR210_33125 [Rhizobium leguminosarum]|nr:hypothetical protein [Rhizobium leguminosarum]
MAAACSYRCSNIFTQFRTENRFALFLELLLTLTQSRTENRFALFLELLQACASASRQNRPVFESRAQFPRMALTATIRRDRSPAAALIRGLAGNRVGVRGSAA